MDRNLQTAFNKLQRKKTELSKEHKIALGLLDNFSYGKYEELEEQVSNMSYFVDEWFPEKFDQWYTIGREIYSIYFQRAEPMPTRVDFEKDLTIISEIEEMAYSLGMDPQEVYSDIELHKQIAEDGLYYLGEMEKQADEFKNESKSV